jgi:predicted signal transduction protein with EAL and GGDEF domain/CheY-like chemotaxis protein
MIYETTTREKPLALVADDDSSIRLSTCAALKKVGFDVLEAENGRLALALFKSEQPDLILLDVQMPEMDGFETCVSIRDLPEGKYSQILMVTGLDDSESTIKAFEAGANDFVSKPINWVMLKQRAKYMLRAGQAFREMHISQSRLAKTQELAKLGNWQVDLIRNNFFCSPQASQLLGLNGFGSPVPYNEFFSTVIPQDRERVKQTIDNAIRLNKTFHVNYRIVHLNGTQKHILNQGETLLNENNLSEIMLGVVQDVSQLKQAEEEIRYLAFYDGLTGLANRILFLDRLDMEIKKAKRDNHRFALLFLDLDQFKVINDTFGHHTGDRLLKNVADALKNNIRGIDTATRFGKDFSDSLIARLGGDEFTIMLSNIKTPENAAIVARRLLKELSTTHHIEGHEMSVTTSIGISVFPDDGHNPDILLKNADSAMYLAKKNGRNKYQFYEESLNQVVMERFNIEKDLLTALKREEFVLFYQPKVNLQDRRIVGAEALIRWMHPQKGMIAPNRFIPIAEESNLIIDINKWVLQAACQQHNEWIDAGLPPVCIALNLSGYRFAEQDIVQSAIRIFEKAHLNPKNFELEITENILMQNTDEIIATLKQIKDLSFSIAIDDFGTGYSSLRYLTIFPVDTIKIDRSFVMGATMQTNNRIIIKAIIAMGHSMGKKIVAEGIETEEQFHMLKKYGCDEAQGYFFKPPVQADEFATLLRKGIL